MYILLLISLSICAIIAAVYHKRKIIICKSTKRLNGKTAIVTGGTAGMGLEIAKDFARRGARVIIACPFVTEGINARELIIESTKSDNVIFEILDLASFKSVRQFAEQILRNEERLDILINNAGIASRDMMTEDGLNISMQVNYLGHFLLTILLLPLLKKTAKSCDEPARIVNTGSIMQRIIKTLDLSSFNVCLNGIINYNVTYARSKVSLLLFTIELAKRLKGTDVLVNCVDPGAVGTGIYKNCYGNYLGTMAQIIFRVFSKTPFEGCQTALHVALEEDQLTGSFFSNCTHVAAPNNYLAYDSDLRKRLWEESVKLVKLSDTELNVFL
ncbi:retinol dehydrogenase 12-like [Aphomia sociella]